MRAVVGAVATSLMQLLLRETNESYDLHGMTTERVVLRSRFAFYLCHPEQPTQLKASLEEMTNRALCIRRSKSRLRRLAFENWDPQIDSYWNKRISAVSLRPSTISTEKPLPGALPKHACNL